MVATRQRQRIERTMRRGPRPALLILLPIAVITSLISPTVSTSADWDSTSADLDTPSVDFLPILGGDWNYNNSFGRQDIYLTGHINKPPFCGTK